MSIVVKGETQPFGQWDVISFIPRVMPFSDSLVDVFVSGGSGVMHVDYNMGRFTCIVNRLLLWASLLRFIVNRYNSDFPYPVFAALPLVLVTGKTGKIFSWEFVYMDFPEGRVLRRYRTSLSTSNVVALILFFEYVSDLF